MTKPVLILDPDWRQMDELFSNSAHAALFDAFDVIWGQDGPIPDEVLDAALPHAEVLVSATPRVDAKTLARAPQLQVIIEVSGAFPGTIDYAACFAAGVEVLSCAPGFRQAVAEMGLGMAIAGARGLMCEHERFRRGHERWLSDNPQMDFTLFGARIGFIGFGQIAQEMCRLLAPFRADIVTYDPWLPAEVAAEFGVTVLPLEEVMASARCLFVTAVPTSDNHHMLSAARLALMPDHALLVLISRAHLVDFDALTAELATGRIRACIDVFPTEPVPQDAQIRQLDGVILSPHRAAAVDKGRQLIGDMIVADLAARAAGKTARQLSRANAATIDALTEVFDDAEVASMAKDR
ncbi:MAG: NAD(P)-dependent oxidoreductase [Pseudomonadota bacterium]